MISFVYNDIRYELQPVGSSWNVLRCEAGGRRVIVGAGLFPWKGTADACCLAEAFVQTAYPVGVKLVGPDVQHPMTVGDLRIVGPNVGHPNFIYWDKDSTSCAPS